MLDPADGWVNVFLRAIGAPARPTGCATRTGSIRASCSSAIWGDRRRDHREPRGHPRDPDRAVRRRADRRRGIRGAAAPRDAADALAGRVLHCSCSGWSRSSSTSSFRSCSTRAPVSRAARPCSSTSTSTRTSSRYQEHVVRLDAGVASLRRHAADHARPVRGRRGAGSTTRASDEARSTDRTGEPRRPRRPAVGCAASSAAAICEVGRAVVHRHLHRGRHPRRVPVAAPAVVAIVDQEPASRTRSVDAPAPGRPTRDDHVQGPRLRRVPGADRRRQHAHAGPRQEGSDRRASSSTLRSPTPAPITWQGRGGPAAGLRVRSAVRELRRTSGTRSTTRGCCSTRSSSR